jgi:hypothetical protein
MKLALNLLVTAAVMVLLLLAVGLLGGVGTIELWLWLGLLVVALVVVAKRTDRSGQGASS